MWPSTGADASQCGHLQHQVREFLAFSVEKDGMTELYTGGMGEKGEMHKNFILSKRAREAHYLCSETATYVGGDIKRD